MPNKNERYRPLDTEVFMANSDTLRDYIEKQRKIKLECTGEEREQAKLSLSSLYGKMAVSTKR